MNALVQIVIDGRPQSDFEVTPDPTSGSHYITEPTLDHISAVVDKLLNRTELRKGFINIAMSTPDTDSNSDNYGMFFSTKQIVGIHNMIEAKRAEVNAAEEKNIEP